MKLTVLSEAGYDEAALGFSLSYASTPERAKELFPKLAHKQGGHNKFLESIMVWLDVTAPRYWWAQADTYRIGTKQSESTMHTLMKRELVQSDFEHGDFRLIDIINEYIRTKNLDAAKAMLPESFLQRRIWCLSYKTLQNIVHQREKHKLREWQFFCDTLKQQLEHPELIWR